MGYAIAVVLPFMLSVAVWGQNGTTERREATLAEQKMYADQAAKVDAQDPGKSSTNTVTHNYTSHYDPKANVCYVMIYNMYLNKDNSAFTTIALVDAFEGRGYGLFTESPTGHVNQCMIPIDHSHDNNCRSQTEFKALALKLYGISQ